MRKGSYYDREIVDPLTTRNAREMAYSAFHANPLILLVRRREIHEGRRFQPHEHILGIVRAEVDFFSVFEHELDRPYPLDTNPQICYENRTMRTGDHF